MSSSSYKVHKVHTTFTFFTISSHPFWRPVLPWEEERGTDATMGITGLLPLLKSITETRSIEEYRGRTLAIDGYCWLHRAIYSCSQEICLGQNTDKYVTYFMDRLAALQHYGVTPYVVFDGGPLPMKRGTEEERRKLRQKNRELGIEHYDNKRFREARKCFIRAADVSPYMAHRVIQRLKAQNVLYVVAPYEADAQLAYLVKNGLADGVISEDSDCLPFGCQTVLFKMDRDNAAQEIQMVNLKKNKGLSFHMFTEQMFLEMCIFSGCDYLPSIPGFGIKRAYTAMKQHGSFAKIIRALRLEGKVRIPATYEDDFAKAVLTFRHQRVYCPEKKELVPLTPIPSNLLASDPTMDFVGPVLPSDLATEIANGDVDPITMKRFRTQVLLPSNTSFQSSPDESVVQKPAAPLVAPKADITPSIHASKLAAVAAPNASSLCPADVRRKMPVSFRNTNKVTPAAALPTTKSSQSLTVDSAADTMAATPLLTSRFFEKKSFKKMSPLHGSVTSGLPRSMDGSSYQSQETCKIDLSKDVTFDPQSDESRVLHTLRVDGVSKENRAPNLLEAVQNVPSVAKETAFSRMMRAGSMLQQHKVKKRKTHGAGVRSGKLHITHQAHTSGQIERFVFPNKDKSGEAEKNLDIISKVPRELPTTTLNDDRKEDNTCTPATSTESCVDVVRKATVSTFGQRRAVGTLKIATGRSLAPLASFDRFRFKY
uniref:Exonuclease 1 n=1 Tax=Peronospora matthiolae TaxID=2874970 RepID=A0AAV1UIW6_9STRA